MRRLAPARTKPDNNRADMGVYGQISSRHPILFLFQEDPGNVPGRMSLLKEYAKVLNEFALNRSCPARLGQPARRHLQPSMAFHKAIRPPNPCFIRVQSVAKDCGVWDLISRTRPEPQSRNGSSNGQRGTWSLTAPFVPFVCFCGFFDPCLISVPSVARNERS